MEQELLNALAHVSIRPAPHQNPLFQLHEGVVYV